MDRSRMRAASSVSLKEKGGRALVPGCYASLPSSKSDCGDTLFRTRQLLLVRNTREDEQNGKNAGLTIQSIQTQIIVKAEYIRRPPDQNLDSKE